MSWFGFGGSKDGGEKSSGFDDAAFSDDHTQFAQPSGSFSPQMGSSSAGSLESELMMEQQKALVQAIMFKLTETSFAQCVTKPSSSLSSSEQNCITAVVTKYLDASEFVVKRMSKG